MASVAPNAGSAFPYERRTMTVVQAEHSRPARARLTSRPVLAAHIATLLAGFGVWLYLDRHLWFYGDEWDFIVLRGVLHAKVNLWAPHNEHWSTLPILAWRALFSVFHLDHYWPYIVVLLLVHVCVIHLMWRRCLLEGVAPWLATAAGLLLALLGSAAEDLTWAFQIGFLGSLAFGLVALELVEARRPTRVTYLGALLAAVASLMCSDIGVAMVAAFAVLALARLGWGRATALVAPPTAAFVVWFALIGREGAGEDHVTPTVVRHIPHFIWQDVRTDITRIFDLHRWAFLAPVLIIGLLVWVAWGRTRLARQHPVVLALLAGDLVFHVLTALARARFGQHFSPSRYVYIDFVFLVPALCIALCWRPSGAPRRLQRALCSVVALALCLCTLGNLREGATFARARTQYVLKLQREIEGAAQLLAAGQPAIAPHPIIYSGLTPSGLLTLERSHLLPVLALTPARRDTALTTLEVAATTRRLVGGRLVLVGLTGGAAAGDAGRGCVSVWGRRGASAPRAVLQLAPHGASGAARLTSRASTVKVFLSPRYDPLRGEVGVGLPMPMVGRAWLSDAMKGDYLLLNVPSGRSKLCGLGSSLSLPKGV